MSVISGFSSAAMPSKWDTGVHATIFPLGPNLIERMQPGSHLFYTSRGWQSVHCIESLFASQKPLRVFHLLEASRNPTAYPFSFVPFVPFLPSLWAFHGPEVNSWFWSCFMCMKVSIFVSETSRLVFARKNSLVSFREKSLCLEEWVWIWCGGGEGERESLWMNQNRNSKRFWSFGRKEENNKTLMYYFLSVMSAEKLGSGPRNFTLSPRVCFSSGGVGFSFDGSFPFLLSHSKLH